MRTLFDGVTVQEGGLIAVTCPGAPAGAIGQVSVSISEDQIADDEANAPPQPARHPDSDEPMTRGVSGDELRETTSLAPLSPHTRPPQPPTDSHGFQAALFGDATVSAMQPWDAPAVKDRDSEIDADRRRLLVELANGDIGRTETKVGYILKRFPDARDSVTSLCMRYWETHQTGVLDAYGQPALDVLFELTNVETIARHQRMIQNTFGLFRSRDDIAGYRKSLAADFSSYMRSHHDTPPEIRLYLDETGNDGDTTFTGVGGVCVANWKQYDKHHEALDHWRQQQDPTTLHFSRITDDPERRRATRLLEAVRQRRYGMLFIGHSISARGRTYPLLMSLFVNVALDSLVRLRENGCLEEPRSLQLVKEADQGFDHLHLLDLNDQLEDALAVEFPSLVIAKPVLAVNKGRHALLECADLIAGAMRRRALNKGRHPKDMLAEAIMNITGFGDAEDTGALYKFHAAP